MKKRLYLATAAAAISALTQPTPALAEETKEIIVVTGIRSSLERAADIKREADGVVDAISAEDIGKFPDTNLAESLQRITGVSIDRQSNEGNQISVRGMGPNFNMVTLNGRQMPAASSPEQESIASATQSRAFNFAEIASESVTGVEVYKTARANVPSGGIGATVNIKTARPFDFDGTKVVASISGVHDSSVEEGDDVTPEISGLFSTTLAEGTIGLLANVSYSKREFSEISTHTDGWLRDEEGSDQYTAWCQTSYDTLDSSGNVIATTPTGSDCDGAPYVYRPVTQISEIQHVERTRTNAQFVAQFAPVDEFIITADYVLSRFERDQDRYQTGLFGVPSAGAATTNTMLASNYTLDTVTRIGAGDALVYENELVVDNDAFGLNIDWELSDALNVTVDFHTAKAESQPDGELNDNLQIIQGPLGINFDLAYSGSGVNIDVDDSGANRPGATGPVTEFQDVDGFSPLGSVIRNIEIENTVDQFQFEFDLTLDDAQLVGGLSYIDYEVNTRAISSGFRFQGLGACTGCSDAFTRTNISAPSGFNTVVELDVNDVVAATFPTQIDEIIANTPPTEFGASEETLALFANYTKDFDIADVPATISAGLRYEDTSVSGTGFQNFPLALSIVSETEGFVVPDPDAPDIFVDVREGYTAFLPSLDLSVRPTEQTVARFSYGESIARPDLNALRPVITVSDYRPGQVTASDGNPALKPYSAQNYDFALEYYYGEGSYTSLVAFHKRIDDYIATEVFQEELLDSSGQPLRDPQDRFDPMVLDPSDPTGNTILAVTSEPTDPIAEFDVSRSTNSEQRTVSGVELAVQHLFADTGFGLQANYTIVDSNVDFNPNVLTGQAILIGLSDSANLVGYYEDDLFSVRLAANWRDEFLFSENQLRATNEPVFIDEYIQLDLSAQMYLSDNFQLVFEALNLTGEDQKATGRFNNQFLFENKQEPRFTLGIRGEI